MATVLPARLLYVPKTRTETTTMSTIMATIFEGSGADRDDPASKAGDQAPTDGGYQAPVPPDEQINPSPSYPQAPPLPGTPDPLAQPEQAAIPQEPQPDAGTPNPYPQSEQPLQGSTAAPARARQPDPWTITDVPDDAPDETEQAQENQGPQEPPLP